MPNLTVKQVNILAKGKPSKTSDGNGLLFVVPNRGEPYWSLRYSVNGKRREKSLGKAQQITLAEARGLAEEARTKLREGLDPLSKFAGSVLNIRSMDELFNDYHQNKLLRLVHPSIPKRKYQNDISPYIGNMNVSNVTPIHVRNIIRSIADSERPSVSNDVLDLLNSLFKHATQLGLTLNNPASVFSYMDAGGQEEPRTRYLTLEEIKPVYEIFRQHPESFTRDNYLACCLLLVLGVRKNELLQAPWAEFDLTNAVWYLPKNRTKKKYKGINIIKGFFSESLNDIQIKDKIKNISLAFIDCDLAVSSYEAFKFIKPRLNDGAFIMIDDYFNLDTNKNSIQQEFVKHFEINKDVFKFKEFGIGGIVFRYKKKTNL